MFTQRYAVVKNECPFSPREKVRMRGANRLIAFLNPLTPTLGKLLLRCSTTYVHVGVSRREREFAVEAVN